MTDSFETPPSSFENPAAQALTPSPPPQPIKRQDTCDLAIVSMVISLIGALYGLFCIGFPFAVAGIVCGHIARSKIRKESLKGDGFALTGLIVGYIVVLLSILAGALLALTIVASAANSAYEVPVTLDDVEGVGELPLHSEVIE